MVCFFHFSNKNSQQQRTAFCFCFCLFDVSSAKVTLVCLHLVCLHHTVARVIGGLFLVAQLVLLVDFAYAWNENWVERGYVREQVEEGVAQTETDRKMGTGRRRGRYSRLQLPSCIRCCFPLLAV
jgi:hypothetical protein